MTFFIVILVVIFWYLYQIKRLNDTGYVDRLNAVSRRGK